MPVILPPGVALSPSSNTQNTITPVGGATVALVANGTVSCPGAGAGSERFGANTLAAGANAVALGPNASASTASAIAIGNAALASQSQSIAIGLNAAASGTNSVALGNGAAATNSGCFALGPSSLARGTGATAVGNGALCGLAGVSTSPSSTAIGNSAICQGTTGSSTAIGTAANDNGFNGCLCLGSNARATANNQAVIGSTTTPLLSLYLGKGVTSATPAATGINATGGSGANIAGAALTLAGGQSTGSAKGGDVIIATAPAGGAGSGLNALATLAQFTGDSKIGFFGGAPVVKQTGASAAGIAAILDPNASAAIGALQTALANLGLITSPA